MKVKEFVKLVLMNVKIRWNEIRDDRLLIGEKLWVELEKIK